MSLLLLVAAASATAAVYAAAVALCYTLPVTVTNVAISNIDAAVSHMIVIIGAVNVVDFTTTTTTTTTSISQFALIFNNELAVVTVQLDRKRLEADVQGRRCKQNTPQHKVSKGRRNLDPEQANGRAAAANADVACQV